jgi:organic radical activating enzyme
VFAQHNVISDISSVFGYSIIMITGGEPMLYPEQTLALVRRIRRESDASVYLYSSLFREADRATWVELTALLDGFQFTLHAEADDFDIVAMEHLSAFVATMKHPDRSFRLSIDHRLYEHHDFSNLDLSGWDVVRKLTWVEDCPLPQGEELFLLRVRPDDWDGLPVP